MSHSSSSHSGMLNHKSDKVFSLVWTLGNSNIAIIIRRCNFTSALMWLHSESFLHLQCTSPLPGEHSGQSPFYRHTHANSTTIPFTSYRVPIYIPGWAAMWTKVPGNGGNRTRPLSVRVEQSHHYTKAPPQVQFWLVRKELIPDIVNVIICITRCILILRLHI